MTNLGSVAFTTAKWVGGVTFTFGAVKGFSRWLKWLKTREYLVIEQCDSVSPVVNVAHCAGALVLNVVGSGLASAVVGVTAPVSVPIISTFATKKSDRQPDQPDQPNGEKNDKEQ